MNAEQAQIGQRANELAMYGTSHASLAAEIARLRELLQRIANAATDRNMTRGDKLKQILHVLPCEFFPGVPRG
jgi:hypothetical protein